MKRISFLIGTLLLIFSLVAVQAFAADTKTNMQGQSLQTSGASSKTFYKGNDILGKEAVTANGEDIGSVEDVAIGQDGRIAYVILARGEVLGLGGKLVPIPWDMVSFRVPADKRDRDPGERAEKTSEDAKLVINVAKQDLDQAPTLNTDEWHRLTDSNFDRQVHSYFEKHRGGASGAMKHPGKDN